MAGFAGLVDVGLRYSFYSEDGHEKSGVKALSRLLPYFMSGLSLLSGLVFATFWFFPLSPDLRKYWLLLLGIFLYLPFIFFVSSREKLPYFGQVPLKTRLSLILVSTAEWGTALVSFLSVAYLMGLHVPLYNLIPLYFLAVDVYKRQSSHKTTHVHLQLLSNLKLVQFTSTTKHNVVQITSHSLVLKDLVPELRV